MQSLKYFRILFSQIHKCTTYVNQFSSSLCSSKNLYFINLLFHDVKHQMDVLALVAIPEGKQQDQEKFTIFREVVPETRCTASTSTTEANSEKCATPSIMLRLATSPQFTRRSNVYNADRVRLQYISLVSWWISPNI
jgi:hypothetical protein